MENKQTAVDWLIEKLVELDKQLDGRRINQDSTVLKINPTKLFKQAKQMEKEQIKDAFVKCWESNIPNGIECKLDAEEYYNETYNIIK